MKPVFHCMNKPNSMFPSWKTTVHQNYETFDHLLTSKMSFNVPLGHYSSLDVCAESGKF